MFKANTPTATFSVRLKPEIKKRLSKLAKASGRSSNFLISDAVESYVADQERMLADVRQSDRQVESGHYIRHEDMKAWLLSWGTPNASCLRPGAPAAKITTTKRRPDSRPKSYGDYLVARCAGAPALDSLLRCHRQAGRGGASRHANSCPG